MFGNALGYAVELGLLPVNPIRLVQWKARPTACAVNPLTVASLAQVQAILSAVGRIRPGLASPLTGVGV